MERVLVALSWLLAAWLGLALAFRWAHTAAWLVRGRFLIPSVNSSPRTRFAVLIPAHNEELLLGETLESIHSSNYPSDLVRVFVVADDCSDRTNEVAWERGAQVFERDLPDNPGKGQALSYGIERLPLKQLDAVCFIDADSLMDASFFAVMDGELETGARILQGYDGLSNPLESRLTRLMAVTSVMKNLLFYGGRRALGLSTLLMGTGMVFRTDVLQEWGWSSFSIGEDLEQSLSLLRAGEKIRFVPHARVYAQEAVDLRQGYVQRQRWATGRRAMRRSAWIALADGLRQRSLSLTVVAAELLLPTYSGTLNRLAMAFIPAVLVLPFSFGPLLALASVGIAAAAEVGIGLVVMGANRKDVAALVIAPAFLVWKSVIDALAAFGYRRGRWTRTKRNRSP